MHVSAACCFLNSWNSLGDSYSCKNKDSVIEQLKNKQYLNFCLVFLYFISLQKHRDELKEVLTGVSLREQSSPRVSEGTHLPHFKS